MPRYVTRPRAAHIATPPSDDGLHGCDWEGVDTPSCEVWSNGPQPTGILDASGNEYFRDDSAPLGFKIA